jgi:streptogramin lyase
MSIKQKIKKSFESAITSFKTSITLPLIILSIFTGAFGFKILADSILTTGYGCGTFGQAEPKYGTACTTATPVNLPSSSSAVSSSSTTVSSSQVASSSTIASSSNISSSSTTTVSSSVSSQISSITTASSTVATSSLTVAVNQTSTQADPSTTGTIKFTAVFNQSIDVSSFDINDVILTGTATGKSVTNIVQVAPNNGTTFEISVAVTGIGTVIANIPAGSQTDYTPATLATTGASPEGIIIDSSGNVFVGNVGAGNVTKITPAGVSSVFATTGQYPTRLTKDSSGNIYTANYGNNNVTKITPAGLSSVFATTGTGPAAITVDSFGNIYTANYDANTVTKITPAGVPSLFATTGTNPASIIFDSVGNLYTGNTVSNNVTKITPAGVSTILGTTGASPYGMTIDSSNNIYTANYDANTVTKITPAGVSSQFGTTGTKPYGITIDSVGNIYTSNSVSNDVTKITPAGVSSTLGTTGASPYQITIDSVGNIYTTNRNSNDVTKFSLNFRGVRTAAGIINSVSSSVDNTVTVQTTVSTTLSLKLFLGGAYDTTTSTMRTDLRTSGVIPATQPFSSYAVSSPLYYTGTESVVGGTSAIPSDCVDWVLVEVKNSTTSANVFKKALMLDKFGTVFDPTDSAQLASKSNRTGFSLPSGFSSGDYNVTVRHRNHIAISNNTPITITAGASANATTNTLNFTNNSNVKSSNQTAFGTGTSIVYGMIKGNANGDDSIAASDRNQTRLAIESSPIYSGIDVNLDGDITAADRNLVRLATEVSEDVY